MGIAILDLQRPSGVLYRSPTPMLEPGTDYEHNGLVDDVVFPSATDMREDSNLDVYYGAADHAIAAVRVRLAERFADTSSDVNARPIELRELDASLHWVDHAMQEDSII